MSEKFVVSARKFRPDSFESLLGQEAVSETLRRAILQQKTAHAYLFCGPRGVGKTSAARIFARAINCASPLASGEACGECLELAHGAQRLSDLVDVALGAVDLFLGDGADIEVLYHDVR